MPWGLDSDEWYTLGAYVSPATVDGNASGARRPEPGSHRAFLALPDDERGARRETGAAPGFRSDRQRPPAPCRAPTHPRPALLTADGSCAETRRCLAGLVACAGSLWGECFSPVPADNGAEFSDWGAIGALLGEREGEPPRQAREGRGPRQVLGAPRP